MKNIKYLRSYLFIFLSTLFLLACHSDEQASAPPSECQSDCPPVIDPPVELPEPMISVKDYIIASDDTWVNRTNDVNYDDGGSVHIGGGISSNNNRDGLLKFDLSSVDHSKNLDKALISIRLAVLLHTPTIDVYRINDDWDEETATGRTQFTRMGEALVSWNSEVLEERTVTMDVTELVKDPELTVLSLLFTAERSVNDQPSGTNSVIAFNSKTRNIAGDPPATLTLTYLEERDDLSNTPDIYQQFIDNDYDHHFVLNDWSTVGVANTGTIPDTRHLKVIDVADFGAKPVEGFDNIAAVQAAIDEASTYETGAVLTFSEGTYHFNLVQEDWQPLTINHPNIVIKGQGQDKTKLMQHFASPDALSGVNFPHFIDFRGRLAVPNQSAWLDEDTQPGDTTIKVRLGASIDFQPGDRFLMSQLSKGSEAPKLEAMSPLTRETERWNLAPYFALRHMIVVKAVTKNENILTVELETPIPYAFKVEHNVDLRKQVYTVSGVGVEDLSLEMVLPQDYSYFHHKSSFHDYNHSAIRFSMVSDSWVRNVSMKNFTLDMTLYDSMFNTIEHLENQGIAGHHSLGFYGNSFQNLARHIIQNAERTHGVSFNNTSAGNVVSQLSNPNLALKTTLDFHGGLPSFNLIELSENVTVNSGGSWPNTPHSGPSNTLWNVTTPGDEVHTRSAYSYGGSNFWHASNGFDHYRLHPRTIAVGVHTPYFLTTIDRSTQDDTTNEWFYSEQMNNANIVPASLYSAQKARRQVVDNP